MRQLLGLAVIFVSSLIFTACGEEENGMRGFSPHGAYGDYGYGNSGLGNAQSFADAGGSGTGAVPLDRKLIEELYGADANLLNRIAQLESLYNNPNRLAQELSAILVALGRTRDAMVAQDLARLAQELKNELETIKAAPSNEAKKGVLGRMKDRIRKHLSFACSRAKKSRNK